MKSYHWWLFNYLLKKIIKQGSDVNISRMYMEIYSVHEKTFYEDNMPTIISFMTHQLLLMSNNLANGGHWVESVIKQEIKEFYKK